MNHWSLRNATGNAATLLWRGVDFEPTSWLVIAAGASQAVAQLLDEEEQIAAAEAEALASEIPEESVAKEKPRTKARKRRMVGAAELNGVARSADDGRPDGKHSEPKCTVAGEQDQKEGRSVSDSDSDGDSLLGDQGLHLTQAQQSEIPTSASAGVAEDPSAPWQEVEPRHRRQKDPWRAKRGVTSTDLVETEERPAPKAQQAGTELMIDAERSGAVDPDDDGFDSRSLPDDLPSRRSLADNASEPLLDLGDGSTDELHDQAPVERVLLGWLTSVMATEACSTWQGARTSAGVGRGYWRSRRNENACWRLWHLGRGRGRPQQVSDSPVAQKGCARCSRGGGYGQVCSCAPDPWRPVPEIEPAGGDPCVSSVIADAEVPPILPPPGLAEPPDRPWRRLLRGTHAFSLQAAGGGISLDAEAPDVALAARQRFKNLAWRRWWATQEAVSKGLVPTPTSSAAGWWVTRPELLFPPTPTSSAAGTPRHSPREILAGEASAAQLVPGHSSAASSAGTAAASPTGPVPTVPGFVLLPVPTQIAMPTQWLAEQLQAALAQGQDGTLSLGVSIVDGQVVCRNSDFESREPAK